MKIAYTVSCTFTDPSVAEEWLLWLRDGHLADVIDGGAESAYVVHIDGDPLTCEARYVFPSREAFEGYERNHAARLRAEGSELFPLDLGLEYSRSVGEIVIESDGEI